MASGDGSNCISLGTYMNKLKSNVSLWEDMVLKSQKLNSNLKNAIQGINSIIESLTYICKNNDKAHYSAVEESEKLLIDLCGSEKSIVDKIALLNNAIQNNLSVNLSFHIENWKRSITNLKKERDLNGNKAKIEYNKALGELKKIDSKVSKRVKSHNNKKYLSDSVSLQLDYANQNLSNKAKFIEELERCSLRKAVSEERNRHKQFLECLRPILDAQLSMKTDLDQLQSIYDKLYSANIENLATIPSDVDSFVKHYQVLDVPRINSLSSLYSRTNSQASLSSSRCSSSMAFHNGFGVETGNAIVVEDDRDISSNTIYDVTNVPPPKQEIAENTEYCDHSSVSERQPNLGQMSKHELLYPNQLIPPPCYSNLRELKQNADKKYGTSGFYQNVINKDPPVTKRWSLAGEISDYQAMQNFQDYAEVSSVQDCNSYATLYNFGSISSGISTFKRRQPSVIKPMNVPVIVSKDPSYQNSHSDHDSALKKELSYSIDRNFGEVSSVGLEFGKMSFFPRNPQIEAVNGLGCNSQIGPQFTQEWMTANDHRARKLSNRLNELDQSNGCQTNSHFKQQLLKVIQGDRPEYHKPTLPVSGRIIF